MSYTKTIEICGNIKIISKRRKSTGNKNKKRKKRFQKTTETQKERNKKLAEEKLLKIIHTNFGAGDYSLMLSYGADALPEYIEAVKSSFTNFIRRLRYRYAKYGKELKYIHVTEYKNKRPHHHMIINGIEEISQADIQEIWGNGFVRSTPLEVNGYYKELADYYIKETSKTFNTTERIYGKRWNSSRNLEQPETIEEIIKDDEDFYNIPQSEEEYELIKGSEYTGVDEFTGLPYVTYTMIKRTQRRRCKPGKYKTVPKNGHLTDTGQRSS